MEINDKLIFDIGLHKGEDTAYYLKKGYRVVAVEANPVLADFCTRKFENEVRSNRLVIVNAGIAEGDGVLPFYINHYSSEWSSFDKATGTRNNTPFEVVNVKCVRALDLFKEYGVPFYMKVDIEGYDYLALQDIPQTESKPRYVSCEANDVGWLDILYNKGYRKFKLINQANNFKPLNLSRERSKSYVMYRKVKHAFKHKLRNVIKSKFPGGSSGPFGEYTAGPWKSYEEIRRSYVDYYQGDLKMPLNQITWLDFHASI